jgi:hypothetical protein
LFCPQESGWRNSPGFHAVIYPTFRYSAERMRACRFKRTLLAADNHLVQRSSLLLAFILKMQFKRNRLIGYGYWLSFARRNGQVKLILFVYCLRFFFLNCLEIFDAVVSPKEFFDRR